MDGLMPWQSNQQRKWGHTPSGLKALGGPAKVAEWDSASKGLKLPRKVKGPRKSVALASLMRTNGQR